jgi:hypothetical protein
MSWPWILQKIPNHLSNFSLVSRLIACILALIWFMKEYCSERLDVHRSMKLALLIITSHSLPRSNPPTNHIGTIIYMISNYAMPLLTEIHEKTRDQVVKTIVLRTSTRMAYAIHPLSGSSLADRFEARSRTLGFSLASPCQFTDKNGAKI